MITALLIGLGLVYLATSMLLFFFGLNLIGYSFTALRTGRCRDSATTGHSPSSEWPHVTIQLPIYNEWFVAERAIEGVCRIDYPRRLLTIQVLDDSDDDTIDVVDSAVAAARRQGFDITVLRRTNRVGYKAGALAAGLASTKSEYIAVFDADFLPPADFLRRALGGFDDAKIAFVQARWGHLNEQHSILTSLQAIAIDAHFGIEQVARGHRGHWFNFNGTCGVWRREAIESAGGWTADTLTEDLDLSYRAHLAGWKGAYLDDLDVPGELPGEISSLRTQQARWARGSIECAIKLLGQVWRSDQRLAVKFQATAHLIAYGVHLLLVAITLLYPAVLILAERVDLGRPAFVLGCCLATASAAPVVFLVSGQYRKGVPLTRALPRVIGLVVLGSGLMLNTVRSVATIATEREAEFERTAKFALLDDSSRSTAPRYRNRIDPIVWWELALGGYATATVALAASVRSWGVVIYASMFASGLFAVAVVSIVHELRRRSDFRSITSEVNRSVLLDASTT